MDITWDYTNQREYVRHINEGMPPVIISAVVTGGHQRSENPAVPVTATVPPFGTGAMVSPLFRL